MLHDGRLLQAPGTWVPPERRGIGFVFQDYALFPHLTVLRNVMFGIRHVPRKRRPQVAREALWMVGLMDYGDRMPHDLSGGQQQRVALARAIAAGSKVILLDEPFSSLDPELRHATRGEIRALAERAKLALVLVTHDQEEALSTSDRLAVMNDGKLLQTGEPEEVYNRPATAFVAQFLGRTNLIEADADGRWAQCELGRVEMDREAAGKVTLSLRPEHLSLGDVNEIEAPHANAGPAADLHPRLQEGVVVSREFKGHDMTYRVRLGKRELTVQTDHRAPHHVGDKVRVSAQTPAAIVES